MYPVRCFSCKKVLGNLWVVWYILTEKKCIVEAYASEDGECVVVDQAKKIKKVLGQYKLKDCVSKPVAADILGLKRRCCRTTMFTTQVYA